MGALETLDQDMATLAQLLPVASPEQRAALAKPCGVERAAATHGMGHEQMSQGLGQGAASKDPRTLWMHRCWKLRDLPHVKRDARCLGYGVNNCTRPQRTRRRGK